MAAHSKLSASGSAKWLTCSAALAMEEVNVPTKPDTGSTFAREGTAAHELASDCLTFSDKPEKRLGESIHVHEEYEVKGKTVAIDEDYEITQEMVNAVEIYINYVYSLQGVTQWYEKKVDYSHLAPHGFGTADALVETVEKVDGKPINTLYVVDFKYGKGVRVDAFENTQGQLYALGALRTFEKKFKKPVQRVVVVIVQPRIDHIAEYAISVPDLLKWGADTVQPKSKMADYLHQQALNYKESGATHVPFMVNETSLTPSDKGCQWCGVKGTCKARANQGYSVAVQGFKNLNREEQADISNVEVKDNMVDTSKLSNAELADVYFKASLFITWLKGLHSVITDKLDAGEYIPGLKSIPTTGNRAWLGDVDATIKALRSAGLQKKDYEVIGVISPTVAEKAIKKVKPKDFKKRYKKLEKVAIHRPAGKDKLVKDEVVDVPEDFLD